MLAFQFGNNQIIYFTAIGVYTGICKIDIKDKTFFIYDIGEGNPVKADP